MNIKEYYNLTYNFILNYFKNINNTIKLIFINLWKNKYENFKYQIQ